MSAGVLALYVVCIVGCAERLINDQAHKYVDKNIVSAEGYVEQAAAVFVSTVMTWLGWVVNRYIKNQRLAAIVMANAQRWDKDMERYLAQGMRSSLAWLKEINGDIDYTKPILPQLTEECREIFNKIKHLEVTAATQLQAPKASTDEIGEIIKLKAPAIRSNPAPTSSEPKKITFLSPDSLALVEKFRSKVK